jgi:hypothetical protein
MGPKAKFVQVFGRLKDEHGRVVFTCSASAGVFKNAAAECVRLANGFVGAKPKTSGVTSGVTSSGCGCSKPAIPTIPAIPVRASYKMSICRCCNTNVVTPCNGRTVVLI